MTNLKTNALANAFAVIAADGSAVDRLLRDYQVDVPLLKAA